MAIESNILSGVGATKERIELADCWVETTNAVPPQPSLKVENGVATITPRPPLRVGQVLLYVGENSLIQMYVAVKTNDSLNESLEWKVVKITTSTIDPITGLPFSSL